MITKDEIIRRADITGVHPHVIEKNYALDWLLTGIFNHEYLKDRWIFKGGTCIKKCYFETYRFSEDLDFTIRDSDHWNETSLLEFFREISLWIEEKSGIIFPEDFQKFSSHKDEVYQGKIPYIGPVTQLSSIPNIKLDLTSLELISADPVVREIFHPYSDRQGSDFRIMAYTYEEVFAEKIRALSERKNPRDLYDVVNLYRHASSRLDVTLLKKILKQKCDFKGIGIPTIKMILDGKKILISQWKHMLGHQLPYLPKIDYYFQELDNFFQWLDSSRLEPKRLPISMKKGDCLVKDQILSLDSLETKFKKIMVKIRFASANHLCVRIGYRDRQGDSKHYIEAYSIGKRENEHFILYTWNIKEEKICTYLVTRITSIEIVDQDFKPRYKIDIIPDLK